jgi:hypothetical protein
MTSSSAAAAGPALPVKAKELAITAMANLFTNSLLV